MKLLLGEFAADWVGWLAPQLGLPAGTAADAVDADLPAVTFEADKVFRLRPPANGLLHLEPQASWDGGLPDRLLLYNTLLHDRHGGPVHTAALLLRREANAKSLTGILSRTRADGSEYLRFEYAVIRAWELSAEPLLAGPVGALPLALLTDEAAGRLPEVVARIDDRLRAENVPDARRMSLLVSGYVLMGLRYNDADIDTAFLGVMGMMESSTYRKIIGEGRVLGERQGLLAGRREDLLDVLRERFGVVPAELEARIAAADDPAALKAALRRALHSATLADFAL